MMNAHFKKMEKLLKKPKSVHTDIFCCPDCQSSDIATIDKINVCMGCKKTLDSDHISQDSGYSDHMRCNMPINHLLPLSSLCTSIIGSKTCFTNDLKRTMTWNSAPQKERSMRTNLEFIEDICREHRVPTAIIEHAQELYHDIIKDIVREDTKRMRSGNDKGIKAAALYISFMKHKKPKTYQEVASIFGIKTRYVSVGIRVFKDRDKLVKETHNDYIKEFAESLNMDREYIIRVYEVVEKVKSLSLLENSIDTSMIAGCIYYVSTENNLGINLRDINERCGVSVPTITKICDKLNKRSLELI